MFELEGTGIRHAEIKGAHIAITGYCNLSCTHCYSCSGPWVRESLKREDIFDILTDLKYLGVKTIYVGGGEPLTHPHVFEILSRIRSLGILPSLSTNATLITPGVLHRLFAAGLRHNLYVSLDGSNESINDSIRGSGTYQRIVEGIKLLQRFKKVQYAVTMVVSKKNLGDGLATAILCKEMGARFLNLCMIEADGRAESNAKDLLISHEEFLREVGALKSHFQCLGSYYGKEFVFALHTGDHAIFIQDTSGLNLSRNRLPLGISIDYEGRVQITPMKIQIGSYCAGSSSLLAIVRQALYDKDLAEKFTKWRSALSFPSQS